MPKKLTQQQILEQFRSVHKERYDYSLFEYKGDEVVSAIICDLHGQFQQMPKIHKKGRGCPECGNIVRLQKAAARKITQEVFEQRCIETHGQGRYNLSLAKYLGDRKKVAFICSIQSHGIFYQTPKDHWRGFGCPKCANKQFTNKEYIEKLKRNRGDKYDYSLVEYVLAEKKIKIICPTHGIFEQIARNHLQGANCPKCNQNKVTKNQKSIYNILKKNNKNVTLEHRINFNNKKYCFVDIFVPEKNIIIEYYGDYWHCNPNKYKADYYHSRKKMYANEIWEYDKQRKDELESMGYKVIVVWESDFKHNKEKVISDIQKIIDN